MPDINEALLGDNTAFTFAAAGSAALGLSGPEMTIDPIGSQLAYLKIGIVITVINDIVSYPTGNTATTFQYAGVYMNYTLFNTAQPVLQATSATPTYSPTAGQQSNCHT